jgi:biotin carboxyl carrier protein
MVWTIPQQWLHSTTPRMETAIRAESNATVSEVLVRPGDRVEAKDLLMVLAG